MHDKKIAAFVTGLLLVGGVVSTLRASSASRSVSAFEQVLAQDEIYHPGPNDTIPETAPAEVFDWAEVEPSLVEG